MAGQQSDLTIDEVLKDPMILALRRADRVDAQAFEALLRSSALAPKSPGQENAAFTPADRERGPSVPAHLCRRMLDARSGSLCAW